jgi:hypothetical protein
VKKKAALAGAALLAVAAAVALARLLGGSSGAAPALAPAAPRYRESPILRERVERGELPPVEKRLPDQPLVVPPVESIGRYDSDTVRRP